MHDAWAMVKKNGKTISEALKTAWANVKIVKELGKRVVEFYFKKNDGSIRKAFGTMMPSVIHDKVKGTGERRSYDHLQTYWDMEKNDWRCFKKYELISFV